MPGYSEDIFDVLNNDEKNTIRPAFEKIASPSPAVLDIGSAAGKWLPVLFPAFNK